MVLMFMVKDVSKDPLRTHLLPGILVWKALSYLNHHLHERRLQGLLRITIVFPSHLYLELKISTIQNSLGCFGLSIFNQHCFQYFKSSTFTESIRCFIVRNTIVRSSSMTVSTYVKNLIFFISS